MRSYSCTTVTNIFPVVVSDIEARWRAIAEYSNLRVVYGMMQKKTPTSLVKKIADSIGVSVVTLRRLSRLARSGRSLERKPGSGRYSICNTPWMKEWFIKQHERFRANKIEWTTRDMVAAMKECWGGFGSAGTVQRLAKLCGFRQVRPRLLPILQENTRSERADFARRVLTPGGDLHSYINDPNTVYTHLDEKWFTRKRLRKRVWVGPSELKPVHFVQSKQQEKKVMFLAGVAKPRPEHNFEGGVAFIPIGNVERARHASANRPRGARVFVSEEINREKTIELIKEIVTDVVGRTHEWARRYVFQLDNAGGHGGGRGDMDSTTLQKLRDWTANEFRADHPEYFMGHAAPEFVFIGQPAHSPDLNILDLGAWNSLQVYVDKLQTQNVGRTVAEIDIHDACLTAWQEWICPERLSKLWKDLELNCRHIVRTNEGTCISPHMRRSRYFFNTRSVKHC